MQLIADSARIEGKISGFAVVGEDASLGLGSGLGMR